MAATNLLPDHATLRADYPGLNKLGYLDTSSMGLMAESTVQAADKEHERLMHEGSARLFQWIFGGNADVARTVAASIGGTEQGTALVQSFSVGLAQLAPLLKHLASAASPLGTLRIAISKDLFGYLRHARIFWSSSQWSWRAGLRPLGLEPLGHWLLGLKA